MKEEKEFLVEVAKYKEQIESEIEEFAGFNANKDGTNEPIGGPVQSDDSKPSEE